MKLNDAVWGVLCIAIAAAVLVAIQAFPRIPGQNIGPGAFPGLVAALLGVCGVVLVVRGARSGAATVALGAWLRSPRHVGNVVVSLGAIAFYIVAVERLGFIPTVTAILVALFVQLRVRPLPAVAIAVIAAFAIHLAFYKGLRVSLPWGALPILY